jgi:hypothetical protein
MLYFNLTIRCKIYMLFFQSYNSFRENISQNVFAKTIPEKRTKFRVNHAQFRKTFRVCERLKKRFRPNPVEANCGLQGTKDLDTVFIRRWSLHLSILSVVYIFLKKC